MKRNVFHSDLIAHKRQVVSKTVGKINQRLQFRAGHIRVTITFLLKMPFINETPIAYAHNNKVLKSVM